MCVCAREHMHVRCLAPLELELQMVVSRLAGVLGTELRSSARTVYVLNN